MKHKDLDGNYVLELLLLSDEFFFSKFELVPSRLAPIATFECSPTHSIQRKKAPN